MRHHRSKPLIALLLSLATIFATLMSATAQAGLITTDVAVNEQSLQYDREQLRELVDRDDIREQLLEYGVQPDVVSERIDALTAEELAQLNTQLDELPAGQDVLGAVVLIFVVFIITDMLCATDLFSFVNCINK